LKPLPLAFAIASWLASTSVLAQEGESHGHDEAKTLDRVQVTASPLRSAIDDVARPVSVLAGEELDARKAGTLGQTLEREAGVQSSFFGSGVGRPIIRGQEGARVQTLSGGMSSADVSTVSADHGVSIEPFLADQIEVLRGPAVLLYGSGAIAGAVNVVDGRIPTAPIGATFKGRAEILYGENNDELSLMARLDGDIKDSNVSWHVDAFRRDADDYGIPGYALHKHLVEEGLAEGETLDEFAKGRMPNSSLETRGAGAGMSWFGQSAWFGAALSRYESDYGIPPGAHAHEEEISAFAEDEEFVRIGLKQNRLDLKGGWRDVGVFREINVRHSRTDYTHTEFEGTEIGTQFENDSNETRLEAVQKTWHGFNGAFGVQFNARDFSALGDEAFVPPSQSHDSGIFFLQERAFGPVKLEFGARHDRIRIKTESVPSLQFSANSIALGGIWDVSENWHVSLNFDRAQRAPTPEELLSDGPHIATNTYEIGDLDLNNETANNAELGLHVHRGRYQGKFSMYRTRYDGFIYLRRADEVIDDLPAAFWRQDDALFKGWEMQASADLADNNTGLWRLSASADRVDARLSNGEKLPRIAPARFGTELLWQRNAWTARVGAQRISRQNDVAIGEEATDGYTLINANLTYHWDKYKNGYEIFLDGRNLGNEEARAHTSFLKEIAPLPGRAFSLGLRLLF
jgi:iron complex outermembrane recepter protein